MAKMAVKGSTESCNARGAMNLGGTAESTDSALPGNRLWGSEGEAIKVTALLDCSFVLTGYLVSGAENRWEAGCKRQRPLVFKLSHKSGDSRAGPRGVESGLGKRTNNLFLQTRHQNTGKSNLMSARFFEPKNSPSR